MFRSNGLVAVEALKSMHNTFFVCFPCVGVVNARQWSSSPRRCASHTPACCRAGLAVCCGVSLRRCRVRPLLQPHCRPPCALPCCPAVVLLPLRPLCLAVAHCVVLRVASSMFTTPLPRIADVHVGCPRCARVVASP